MRPRPVRKRLSAAASAAALLAVNTSVKEEGAPPVITPGRLVVIDIASRAIIAEVEIGDGPDSVAVTRIDGVDVAVVAIENEPVVVDADGNLTDGEDPGLPGDVSGPGLVQVVALEPGGPPRAPRRDAPLPRRPAAGVRQHPGDEGRGHPPGEQRHRDHRHRGRARRATASGSTG